MLKLEQCPCGKKNGKDILSFTHCCGRYLDHFDTAAAPDAESLMRSRYTAFVLERADYLMATWIESHRPAELDFDARVKWLGLEVKSSRLLDAQTAEVEFVARSRHEGKGARLHEVSRFIRREGRWFYVDGEIH